MYCVKCGVRLAETEKVCPLCDLSTGEAITGRNPARPLYPENRYPEAPQKPRAVNGTILILFCIPMLVTFFTDIQSNGKQDWFWYVAGALVLAYLVFALPLWFRKPNPVILVPCDFAASALYLLLINTLTEGRWFFGFALPIVGSMGLVTTTVVVLLRYVRKGRLYIAGGVILATGAWLLFVEWLLSVVFRIRFTGWSLYPLTVLIPLGGLLIFLAIHSAAREKMERKFFI